jgi:hypothetical protein
MGYFSDGPEKSLNERLLVIFPLYTIASLLIGALASTAWKIAVLSSWASFFMGGAIFLGGILGGDISTATFGFTGFVILPLISLLFGYLGSRLSSELVLFLRTKSYKGRAQ